MDPATNKIVWQKQTTYPMGTGSGLLSTAGGLIFHGESDGNLVAYDISNGEELWKFQTGAGANGPVSTFEADGEQYVAVLAGGNNILLSPRGDFLWTFKLGGTLPEAPARTATAADSPGAAAAAALGARLSIAERASRLTFKRSNRSGRRDPLLLPPGRTQVLTKGLQERRNLRRLHSERPRCARLQVSAHIRANLDAEIRGRSCQPAQVERGVRRDRGSLALEHDAQVVRRLGHGADGYRDRLIAASGELFGHRAQARAARLRDRLRDAADELPRLVEREVLRFVMVRLARQVGVDQLDAAAIHDDRPAAVQGDGHEVRPPPVVVDAHNHRPRLRSRPRAP